MSFATDTPFTDDQRAAYDEVYDRLARGERYTGLRGYAGTGKTYLVSRLVEQLVEEDCTVTVCAPTHKAVQVLSEELGEAPVEMQTLHSFLGLRLRPTEDGEYELVAEEQQDYTAGVVIVDEASMIGREEWRHIEDSPFWLQWLFVGDPAQLPPVNEDPSPALDVPGPTLETIHRQAADNPILELATQIRKGTDGRFGSRFEDGKGVAITRHRDEFLDSVLRAFDTEAFAEDATHARVLAYRNKTVRRYNREIRAARYGTDAERFVEKEWLVATETWFHEGVPRLTNSEEVRVKTATVDTFEADDQSEWTVWKLKVRAPGRGLTRTAHVLHEDEFERYENALERRREAAKEDGSKWDRYYELRERFARVDYAYASTVHKCLPEEARIETERGPRPIGEILEGDRVWTGRKRLRPVAGVFRTGARQVFQVRTASGTTLESSPEHRFLTQRGWVEAKSLREDDAIAFARPTLGTSDREEQNEAYLTGYLAGDGTYSYESNRVDVALHKESPLYEWIRSSLERHGAVGENPKAEPSKPTTLWGESTSFRNQLLSRGLRIRFHLESSSKSQSIFPGQRPHWTAFARKRGWSGRVCSRHATPDSSHMNLKQRLRRVTGEDKTCPRLDSNAERRSFLRGLFDADGSASSKRTMVRSVNTCLLDTKYFYDPVDTAEPLDETREMVDIEVEEDHSFVYRGAIVHNSQGSTFDTVFVDHRDLQACRGEERQALLYVAVTRPARRLALLV